MLPTVKDIVKQFSDELSGIYSSQEAFHLGWLIFEHLHGWSKTDMMMNDQTKLSLSDHLFIEIAIERLKKHEPIQYIIGETEFFSMPFDVNPSVLVPRPETEELVEWVLHSTDPKKSIRILDIGTGTGCIAISIAKHLPEAKVSAWDISDEALHTATRNADKNKVNVLFQKTDILNVTPAINEYYDIIVSNPPYVRNSEKIMVKPNVLDYEPHLALFVSDEDPLLFYRKITQFASLALKEKGMLFFEINRDFGVEIKTLLKKHGFSEVELKQDLSGNNRMIKAIKISR